MSRRFEDKVRARSEDDVGRVSEEAGALDDEEEDDNDARDVLYEDIEPDEEDDGSNEDEDADL
jgi:hypothetical protein